MYLTADAAEYQIVNNFSQQDGNFSTRSTITFLELNLPQDDAAIVRCSVVDNHRTITVTELNEFFIISK